ncbi:MAG: asparagine--tRNA ligase [Acidobacteria bacterium]|jgi:asparaginyl-tRNA synthetase|nr:asparagine--tRNA ligase [Acidobacteriota bacterium]MEE2648773.1 asparagine--tRNA ligase [Acidobacteriota bacterium]|tara:strand:- start:8559 stop:9854 length:1296 start_codon:yes stop_codon:yes gene_type:complete
MPESIYIADLGAHEGETVTVRGWLYNKRSSGKIAFMQLRDGTGMVQAVATPQDVDETSWNLIGEVTQESSIIVTGSVRADARSPTGFELGVELVEIVQMAPEYPISPKEHGTEFLMDHRHLWLRSSSQVAALRVRSKVIHICRSYYHDRGFVLIDSPILTPISVEGTTTLFSTDYFGENAYLTQSGQLYLEPACMAHGRVYCFGPTFRAEKSKTRRHLIEFWMLEPEVAYATLDDAMELAEDFISHVVQTALVECKYELEVLNRDTTTLERVVKPFPRILYDEAVEILREAGQDFEWGGDFGGGHETIISEAFDRPVLVHRFPTAIKAFYMEPDPERQELALAMDMIAPEGYGEIIGGSQRIHDHDLLLSRIRENGLNEKHYEWYLDVRRYGSVPHSGFGMGLERVIAWITGVPHLRETIPYPRLLGRLTP